MPLSPITFAKNSKRLWGSDVIALHAAMASVAAFAVVVGLQSFFGSFVAYLLASEHARPMHASPLVARIEPVVETAEAQMVLPDAAAVLDRA
jgi:hypothetical protein